MFTLSRWRPSAWLLFGSLLVMLTADTVYAQSVANGTAGMSTVLDALWPISYLMLAGATLHPSMCRLWSSEDVESEQYSRARMAILGAALFAAPAVVILDNAQTKQAAVLAVITGVAAILVAWRITRLVAETNSAREVL